MGKDLKLVRRCAMWSKIRRAAEALLDGRRFWVAISLLSLLGVTLVTLGVLRYGNPQWHRRIFMFQAYTWPGYRYSEPPSEWLELNGAGCFPWTDADRAGVWPSPDFTGVWVSWDREGRKVAETSYNNGKRHGKDIVYRPDDGSVAMETYYESGMRHGSWTSYLHGPGKKDYECHYENGELNGKSTRWDERGNIVAEGTYESGSPWDGTFMDGCFDKPRRYKEGRPWDGIFEGRIEGSTQRFRFLENGVELSSLILGQDLGSHSYKGNKPWYGAFLEWDEVDRQLVVRKYEWGQITQTHAGRFPTANGSPR